MTQLSEIDITIENGHWLDEAKLRAMIESAVTQTAETAGLTWPQGAELSLLFTDDTAMAEINGQWRDKPKPTNVLSFPGGDVAVGEAAGIMIGDLVFAYETVHREAVEQQKAFEDHLTHLMVHGFLHLFGHDHMNDEEASRMEALEIATLEKLGIANPYA